MDEQVQQTWTSKKKPLATLGAARGLVMIEMSQIVDTIKLHIFSLYYRRIDVERFEA